MDQELARAMGWQRVGRVEEAEEVYRGILGREPGNGEVMQLLGLAAAQRGRLAEGVAWIVKALVIEPGRAEWWLNLGEVQRRMGRLEEAVESLRRGVSLEPGNAWGVYNLGVALRTGAVEGTEGRRAREEVAGCFRRAVGLMPTMAEGWNNLGTVLMARMQLGEAAGGGIGEAEEAVEAFGRAAALRPGKGAAGALANRGMLLRRLGRSGEAVEAFGRAVELEGSGAVAGGILRELAMALLEEKRFAEAEETAARATEAARGNGEWAQESEAWRSLGIIRGARGDRAGGLAAYEKALAIAKRAELAVPEDWRIEKEVLEERAGSGRTRLPEEFVRRLFDGYALRFEKHLVGELGYRMPALLAEAVAQARGEGGGQVVVDLGCGTGLCGEAFVEFARGPGGRLVGVDLSGVMVERARSRKIYEELIVGEIGEAMRKMPEGSVDLLVAGDVFIYVGELAAIFAEARRVLRRGGLLAFSVERPAGEGSAEGLQFTGGGRFAHSEGYLRQRAAAAGLEVVMVREAFLRGDVGNGSIVLLRRPVSG